jgi:hypothetical protein
MTVVAMTFDDPVLRAEAKSWRIPCFAPAMGAGSAESAAAHRAPGGGMRRDQDFARRNGKLRMLPPVQRSCRSSTRC